MFILFFVVTHQHNSFLCSLQIYCSFPHIILPVPYPTPEGMHSVHPEETAAQVAWPGADSVGKGETLHVSKAEQGTHSHLYHPLSSFFPVHLLPVMERETMLPWLNGATLLSTLTYQNRFIVAEGDSFPGQLFCPIGILLHLENVLRQRKQRFKSPANLDNFENLSNPELRAHDSLTASLKMKLLFWMLCYSL